MECEELGELVLLDEVANGDNGTDVLEEFLEFVFVLLGYSEVLVCALLVNGPFSGIIEEVRLEVVVNAALEVSPKFPCLHLVHVKKL